MNERTKELYNLAWREVDPTNPQETFMTAFANLVRQDEREACAKECEGRGITYAPHCAAAIRAR